MTVMKEKEIPMQEKNSQRKHLFILMVVMKATLLPANVVKILVHLSSLLVLECSSSWFLGAFLN